MQFQNRFSRRSPSTPRWLGHHAPYTYYSPAAGRRMRHVPTLFLIDGLEHHDIEVEAYPVVHETLAEHGLSPLLTLLRLVAAQPHSADADFVESRGCHGRMKLAGFSLIAQTPEREVVTVFFIVRLDLAEPKLTWCEILSFDPTDGERLNGTMAAVLSFSDDGDMQVWHRPQALAQPARTFALEQATDGPRHHHTTGGARRAAPGGPRWAALATTTLLRTAVGGGAAAFIGLLFGFATYFALSHGMADPPAPAPTTIAATPSGKVANPTDAYERLAGLSRMALARRTASEHITDDLAAFVDADGQPRLLAISTLVEPATHYRDGGGAAFDLSGVAMSSALSRVAEDPHGGLAP